MKTNDNELLTIRDLELITGATAMTIYNWRLRKRTDKTKLPCVRIPRGKQGMKSGVRFKEDVVLKWAETNGVPIDGRTLRRIKTERKQQQGDTK